MRTVRALQRGYVEGRLSTGTFEARLAIAQEARTTPALVELLADLKGRWLALRALTPRPRAVDLEPAVQMTVRLSTSKRARIVVGRSRSCELVVRSPGVSRRHALLERTADGWRVTDLGSTNGTFLDGVRVDRAPITPGASLWLGDALLLID